MNTSPAPAQRFRCPSVPVLVFINTRRIPPNCKREKDRPDYVFMNTTGLRPAERDGPGNSAGLGVTVLCAVQPEGGGEATEELCGSRQPGPAGGGSATAARPPPAA